jgi:hypothetical protein
MLSNVLNKYCNHDMNEYNINMFSVHLNMSRFSYGSCILVGTTRSHERLVYNYSISSDYLLRKYGCYEKRNTPSDIGGGLLS